MAKTIFLLIDGCSDTVARKHLGYLEHLAESGIMARYTVMGELPGSSRPMYETLLTGLPVSKHGVTGNLVCQRSEQPNLFSLCRENGLDTAAAAYYWISELYYAAPFIHARHRLLLESDGPIRNGIFYFEDMYPDSHVLCDAECLRAACNPDFLMIHTMNLDDIGHKFGEGSPEQAKCAMFLDTFLANLLPVWHEAGLDVVITADHGMDANGVHGGNQEELRRLPLYIHSASIPPVTGTKAVSQLAIAPLLCRLLGIQPASGMIELDESGVTLFE